MYYGEGFPGNYVPLRDPVDEEEPHSRADYFHPGDYLSGESSEWEAIADLDQFFTRLYHYYCNHGFWCIVTQWAVELLTLGFTISFSGFLLLAVNWHGLLAAKCGVVAAEAGVEPCHLLKEGLVAHPLRPLTWGKIGVVLYLLIFSSYWLFCFVRFFAQLRHLLEVRQFVHSRLGISEAELQIISWPDLVERMVQSQARQKLCIVRDLSAHDIVSRIMRKENYMVGLLNKNVLTLPLPSWVPGTAARNGLSDAHRCLVLTKTLEWSLNWCILHYMFDENFLVRRDFSTNPAALRKRLMAVGAAMLCLSPFLFIFMLMYFVMRNAEQFYHHPNTAGSRQWSNYAKWKLREFNELQHIFEGRLNASYEPANTYVKQFPSPIVSVIAKFISFVTGALAALLLALALAKESLLEAELAGRNLFWYAAILGTVLAVSRALITEEHMVFDPEGAMAAVAQHTHFTPKHWKGRANGPEVRTEFEALFQFKARLFLEEMGSIFVTPFLLWFCVPKCVDAVLQFLQDFTVHVEGVGHVCSLGVFDFEVHGNSKYGSPFHATKAFRSAHGKMEKSFLSFKSTYPQWEPSPPGKQLLSALAGFRSQHEAAEGAHLPPRWAPPAPPKERAPLRASRGAKLKKETQAHSAMHHSSMMPPVSSVNFTSGSVYVNSEQLDQLYWLGRYHEAANTQTEPTPPTAQQTPLQPPYTEPMPPKQDSLAAPPVLAERDREQNLDLREDGLTTLRHGSREGAHWRRSSESVLGSELAASCGLGREGGWRRRLSEGKLHADGRRDANPRLLSTSQEDHRQGGDQIRIGWRSKQRMGSVDAVEEGHQGLSFASERESAVEPLLVSDDEYAGNRSSIDWRTQNHPGLFAQGPGSGLFERGAQGRT